MRYLVTSALPYANGPLHVGHLAGAYIPADIYVRYLRLIGAEVLFICGSDEHGAAITMRAKSTNSTPKEIVDKYHEINNESFRDFGISFDIYHRTSSVLHHKVSQEFFLKLEEKGVFQTKVVEQYFDEEEELFLADRYIKGQCPKCDFMDAYGDQCENCGSDLSPTDLIDPRSTLSGNRPVLKRTKHWFLPMQDYQEWVSEWIQDCQKNDPWKKHVLGQCQSWIKQGLRERAMTRDLDWGVRVPLTDAHGKVLYVWLDAPIGYISATQALSNEWEKYWKNENTKLIHFIGKDNIVFHCIIFPILLKAHGEFILPSNIPANQFMNLESSKISTSRNHAVWLLEYLERFPGRQDELRYYLTVNMPETKDSDFTWKDYQAKVNGDLVGVLGNFIFRTLSLIVKNFNGQIQYPSVANEELLLLKSEIGAKIKSFKLTFGKSVLGYEFKKAADLYLSIARNGNKLLNDNEPWKLIEFDRDASEMILCLALEHILILVAYMGPILPNSARKARQFLGLSERGIQLITKGNYDLSQLKISEGFQLFKKIEDEAIQNELGRMKF